MADSVPTKVHVKATVSVKVTVNLWHEDELTSDMSLDAIRQKAGEMVTERVSAALRRSEGVKLDRAAVELIRTEDVQFS